VPTVNYVTTLAFHYEMFGAPPPEESKLIAQLNDDQHFQIISYAQLKRYAERPAAKSDRA
jgi:hypothetical protein